MKLSGYLVYMIVNHYIQNNNNKVIMRKFTKFMPMLPVAALVHFDLEVGSRHGPIRTMEYNLMKSMPDEKINICPMLKKSIAIG